LDIGTGLGLVGIVIGVVFGVTGLVFAAKRLNKNRTQSQRVGKGGIAIQSGRDTKIEK
jgi:gas vesicle protein